MRILRVYFVIACLTLAAAASGQEAFPVGWYDVNTVTNHPAEMNEIGGNVSLAYWSGGIDIGNASVGSYLDNAASLGMRVIFEIDPAAIDAQDTDRIRDVVLAYDSHPAVMGWYTYDEPYVRPTTVQVLQTAYDTVRQYSAKPVFMTISEPGVAAGKPVDYKEAYDIFLADSYPLRLHSAPGQTAFETEFTGFEDEPGRAYKSDWKGDMRRASEQALLAGKTWWSAMEGWNSNPLDSDAGYRVPTLDEARFMHYYSLSQGAEGLVSFAFYRAIWPVNQGGSPANPQAPYPDNGVNWLNDVWRQVATEVNTLGPALQGGMLSNIATDDTADIRVDVYLDPDTGEYYLIAINEFAGPEQATISVNLPIEFDTVTRLFEGPNGAELPGVAFANGQFTDTFSDYEVHVYSISTIPEPASAAYLLVLGLMVINDERKRKHA